MIPIWEVLRIREAWELAGRPTCSHERIEVEYDSDVGGLTGDKACLGCGKTWALADLERTEGIRPESNPNQP